MKKIFLYMSLLFVSGTALVSCNKYLDIKPVGTVVPETADDFRGLLTSGYLGFPAHKSYLNLRTDELQLDEYSTDMSSLKDIFLWNDLNPDPATFAYPYITFYKSIFYANQVLETIDKKLASNGDVNQLKAEAYLMRAYAHFELLNMYAETYTPANAAQRGIALSTKIDLEQRFIPVTIEEVYKQIFADIDQADRLMQVQDQDSKVKYRFSKRALYAFQARVFLYRSEWQKSLDAADKALAINSNLEDLNQADAFMPSDFQSKEMILSLDKVALPVTTTSTFISQNLLNSYDKVNDLRFAKYFQKKGGDYVSLKGGDNRYNVSFRNGDLYLMEAEAYSRLGHKDQALAKLNALLKNRLTPAYFQTQSAAYAGLDNAQLLNVILAERKRELALEGLTWYDLKRTTRPTITHRFFDKDFVLQQNDPRYVIRFPKAALENNPDLNATN
ncbi:RagB/SusD family nutrient uptake outer membrane protein [Sphingobacterium sp. Mn56C]|uniref:RagB/SusD family nutrient uptake outer membrane protein n=1 Tax=Sphingobacterium sp. Mn56C TaxID=3395261 RepID=UPI003BCA60C3